MVKTCFLDEKQIIKCPKTTLYKECTYVKKDRNEIEENIDYLPDNEPTFSSSYFNEEPIGNVENTEERLKEMNLHRVQKRENNYRLTSMTKIE